MCYDIYHTSFGRDAGSKMKRHTEIDMVHGPLLKNMWVFALPIIAMNLLQLLFNAADMVVVGRFNGSEALGAVGATGALINLLVNLFMGLSVGTSVIVAQDYGANKPADVSRSVHTSIAVSAIGGIAVGVLGFALCRPLLHVMGTPEDIANLAVRYMRIYFVGMPANMVYNFGAAVLRAVGDSRHPMYYLIISGIVNVILNLFFVVVCKMSVDGVAWATVISQYLSVVMLMICLMRSEGCIRYYWKKTAIDKEKLIKLTRIGLPAGMQGTLFSISNVLIQSAVNSFGSAMVAASSAASNLEGMVGTTMNAYYNAAITFTGQCVGAGEKKRIDSIVKVCLVFIVITWVVLGGASMLFARPLLSIYSTDPAVLDLGVMKLNIMMMVYFTCGIMNVLPGVMRGMGYSIVPMLITLVGACLLRIVWLYTAFAWYPTIPVLFACYPVTWTLAAIGHVVSYLAVRKRQGIAAAPTQNLEKPQI